MKIKYKFINGESTEIEVEEGIGTWILDSRRLEENLARKERYHCYSSGAAYIFYVASISYTKAMQRQAFWLADDFLFYRKLFIF